MNSDCLNVAVYHLCGKDAIRYMRKQAIENRRKKLLLRLIKEIRKLRAKRSEAR